MKRVKHTLLYLLAAGAMLLTGCSDDFFGDKTEQHDSNRIQLSGDIDQLAVTRVNDNGFCNGDVMGVSGEDCPDSQRSPQGKHQPFYWRNQDCRCCREHHDHPISY